MDLLRLLTVKMLSLSLILMPMPSRAAEVERSPLHYKVKRGDSLSEVLDRLLLRPIYPLTGSLRRTIAANPGRFTDRKAQLFAGETIYFAASDEIMLRQNQTVLASGEVRFGAPRPQAPVAPLAQVPAPAAKPVPAPIVAAPIVAVPIPPTVVVPAPEMAQRQEPQESDDAFEPAQKEEAPVPVVKAAKPAQVFPAKEDEESVVQDEFAAEHSVPPARRAPPMDLPFETHEAIRKPAFVPHKPAQVDHSDEPFERDNYFPMLDAPTSGPRASDTKAYQSDF